MFGCINCRCFEEILFVDSMINRFMIVINQHLQLKYLHEVFFKNSHEGFEIKRIAQTIFFFEKC